MSTLEFMPWCRIGKTYSIGETVLIPFSIDERQEAFDTATTSKIETILSSYKDIEGEPVREWTLLQIQDKSPFANLSDDEIELIHECVQLACFSALAKRDYFNPLGPYCNAECFTLYGQRFDDLAFVAIRSRRREGRTLDARSLTSTVFSIPVHVSTVKKVVLDEPLLLALSMFRSRSAAHEWVRWQNAISCFNQANTDNESIQYHIEWVLLASAFEHLLAAKPTAEDVAKKFDGLLRPYRSLSVGTAKRRSTRWSDKTKSVCYEWIKEFYRVRGDFAHGKLNVLQPVVWNPLEHLVLATIAFPLVVRLLLHRAGLYVLTDEDKAQAKAFDGLADEAFLNPPKDQSSSLDSFWARLRHKAKMDAAFQELGNRLKSR